MKFGSGVIRNDFPRWNQGGVHNWSMVPTDEQDEGKGVKVCVVELWTVEPVEQEVFLQGQQLYINICKFNGMK